MKITWLAYATVDNEQRRRNAMINKTLGLPYHRGSGHLAIVGGGPSIDKWRTSLQNWKGGIWAVNGAINWCIDHGIDAAFYTIDAQPIENWGYDLSRVKRAVLAPDCDPSLFAHLKGADVSLTQIPDGGPTSACAADLLSLQADYVHVTYFGCESSYGETTHAFPSTALPHWLDIKVGDEVFRTKPEFILQAQTIANVIKEFPDFYVQCSGGLLAAMVEHGPDYDEVGISEELAATLKKRIAA